MKTTKRLNKQFFWCVKKKKDKSWVYFYVKNAEITNKNSYQRETDCFLSLMLHNALYYLTSHSILDYIIYQGHQYNAKKTSIL